MLTAPNLRGFREFAAFLKEELAPYPGRTAIATRMVIAATLAATICQIGRNPYGFEAALLTFLISHESLRATVTSAATLLVVTCISALYLFFSIRFVVDDPMLHFLWNVGSFFLAFYLLSILSSYLAAAIFAIMLAIGIPLWET